MEALLITGHSIRLPENVVNQFIVEAFKKDNNISWIKIDNRDKTFNMMNISHIIGFFNEGELIQPKFCTNGSCLHGVGK